ncbi:MAG: DUF1570 domain-containing protein [Planctomycetes bacterium]|nr:DUF1570 domain-containing protein [Planctomycetota bacterium]
MKLYECVECGARFDVSQFTPGKQLKCGKCKAIFTVPEDEAPVQRETDFFAESAEAPVNVFKKRGAAAAAGAAPPEKPASRPSAGVPSARRPQARPAPEPEPEPEPEPAPVRRGVRGSAPAPAPSRGGSRGRAPEPASRGGRGGYEPPAKKNNTMLFAGIGGGAVLLLAIGAFVAMGGDKKGKGGSGDSATSEKDEKFAKLKKNADDSASAMFEYAEACEKKGDRGTAEEYYIKAAKKDTTFTKAQDKLRGWYDAVKYPGCNGDLAKLTELIDWLDAVNLKEKAADLAGMLIKQDKDNAKAHKYLEHELYEGVWYEKDQMDLVKVAKERNEQIQAMSKMSVREQRVHIMKDEYNRMWNENKKLYKDCGPEAPYLLCMEESSSYNAELMLEDFKGIVKTLYELFFKRYGKLFNVEEFGANEVCFIYIFENRDRYMKCTAAPYFAGGHFDTTNGRIFIYKDTPKLYETLFHEGIHQLVHNVTQMKEKNDKARRNINMFWFTEGIACFFEFFKRDAVGGFVLGEVSKDYVGSVQALMKSNKHTPLQKMMKITYMEFARNSGNPQYVSAMYAQSWSVVYFFYTYQGGKYVEKFNDYFKREVDMKGGYDPAKEIFGDLEQLNKEYEEYIKALRV